MSGRNSFSSTNGNVGVQPNYDEILRGTDSPYSPGIIETEMISNRSSMYSDILNMNDKSHDFNSKSDSFKHFINENDGLNCNKVAHNNHNHRYKEDNFQENQKINYLNSQKTAVSSTLESAELVDFSESSEDGTDWSLLKKSNHTVSSNAINFLNGDVKKNEKNTNNNSSPLKRYCSGKIENVSDFGQVTQIIGVPPLSASNKDLTSVGKELSFTKQQNYGNSDFEAIDNHANVSKSKQDFGSGYHLTDLSDIQNAAKLQEQSLRMSFSTPLVNGNKGLSLKSSNKKINEAGTSNKLKVKTNPTPKSDQSKGRSTSTRSPARNNVPLSQYNSNGMMNKKLIDKSSKAEPFQKSLPNLTRKLQPARGQTGKTQKAMLPQSGPPVRTASQPTVNSQLKPFQRKQPQRTTSTILKPQGMSLNPRNLNPVKKISTRPPPTSLNSSSRAPNASRQPLSTRQPITNTRQTNSRQPLSTTTRQPLSTTTRQPLSNNTRQPLSNTTRQLLSNKQPLTPSKQPKTTTTRQPYSSMPRQPIAVTNRVPVSNTGRVGSNTASRTNTISRLASGTRTPLSNPPISNRNAPQTRNNNFNESNVSRNAPSYLNRTNQSSSSNRTNLSSAPNRNNLPTNRSNTAMNRGTVENSRTNPATRGNLSTVNRPKSNVNASSSRVPPSSSTNRVLTINKPTTQRSMTPRNATTTTLSKSRSPKPSPVPSIPSNRGDNEDEGDDWKDGCF